MWYDCLDNNKFLIMLYESVPLTNVEMTKLAISDSGNRVTIAFKMPSYPKVPPKKWMEKHYNSVIVELDFFAISNLKISSSTNYYIGSIEINRTENKLIEVKILGNIEAEFRAEGGLVQFVDGYISKPE